MTEFRQAGEEELPGLKALWEKTFGDPEEVVEAFFRLCFRPEGALVAAEEGKIVSMLFLLPFFLVEKDGKRHKMPYIYAFATDLAFRGRGMGQNLLKYAENVAKKWGSVGLCTLPAEPSLYDFYGKMGYEQGLYGGLYPPVSDSVRTSPDLIKVPCFSVGMEESGSADGRTACPGGSTGAGGQVGRTEEMEEAGSPRRGAEEEKGRPGGGPAGQWVPLEAGEYNALRRKMLAGRTYLDLPDGLIAYQKALSRLSGGDLCGLLLPQSGEGPVPGNESGEGTGSACAPGGPGDGAAPGAGGTGDPGEAERTGAAGDSGAVAAVAAVEPVGGRPVVKERLPLTGEKAPFGMVKWLVQTPPPEPIYLGLAFD